MIIMFNNIDSEFMFSLKNKWESKNKLKVWVQIWIVLIMICYQPSSLFFVSVDRFLHLQQQWP